MSTSCPPSVAVEVYRRRIDAIAGCPNHAIIEEKVMSKVLVLYYSAYGHIEAMANAVAEGARQAGAHVDEHHPEAPRRHRAGQQLALVLLGQAEVGDMGVGAEQPLPRQQGLARGDLVGARRGQRTGQDRRRRGAAVGRGLRCCGHEGSASARSAKGSG